MNKILQIVPRIPPAVDGIGDFACMLGTELERQGACRSHYLVGDHFYEPSEERPDISVVPYQSHTVFREQLQALALEHVILHYVGYGYAQRGCPYWLLRGLRDWRQEHGSARLLTVFHELHGDGPLWSSSFWLKGFQKDIVRELIQLSDKSIVSIQCFADQLPTGVRIQPVFSTVGEPEEVPAYADREPTLVVFGSPAHRARIYSRGRTLLEAAIREFEVKALYDIGESFSGIPSALAEIPVMKLGVADNEEISSLLLRAQFGVVEYMPRFLGKSTVFAALCAHGLCPIVVGDGEVPESADGLEPGVQFLNSRDHFTERRAHEAALHAREWYGRHPVSLYASTISTMLFES